MVNLFTLNIDSINKQFIEMDFMDFMKFSTNEYQEIFVSKDILPLERVEFVTWFLHSLTKYSSEKIQRKKYIELKEQWENYLEVDPRDSIVVVNGTKLILSKFQSYGYKNKANLGRFYSEKKSIQFLKKDLRFLLLEDHYFDIDLVSSHLSILASYASKNNIESTLKFIPLYIKHKEIILNILCEITRKHPDFKHMREPQILDFVSFTLKHLIIVFSNKNLPENYKNPGGLRGAFMKNIELLQKDLKIIRKSLNTNSELINLRSSVAERMKLSNKTAKNFHITLQNYYCYTVENYIVNLIRRKVEENSLHFVPMFDGALITKTDKTCQNYINDFLMELNKEIIHRHSYCSLIQKRLSSPLFKSESLNWFSIFEVFEKHEKAAYKRFSWVDGAFKDIISGFSIDVLENLDCYSLSSKLIEETQEYYNSLLIIEFEELHCFFDLSLAKSKIDSFEERYKKLSS